MEGPDPPSHTSLRYLRLQNDFRSMMKMGMECMSAERFMETYRGQAEARHLECVYKLLQRQQEAIIDVAAMEMEAACSEVGLQQQLEELEALILQRGLLGSDDGATTESTALPTAVEAAARMTAKQAEKQRLQDSLQELLRQQTALQSELESKQKQADDLLRDFQNVEDQVDKVYKAGKQWMQPPSSGEVSPMQQ